MFLQIARIYKECCYPSLLILKNIIAFEICIIYTVNLPSPRRDGAVGKSAGSVSGSIRIPAATHLNRKKK